MPTNNLQLNNTVVVYISTFDRNLVVGDVEPAIRSEFIQRCTDTLTKQQSYSVWRLLDYALRDCYGVGVDHFDFTISDNGKWCCNGVYFSLTHCDNVVGVAVCNSPVGVDIEAVASFIRHVDNDGFVERVLTDSEQSVLKKTPLNHRVETLARFWTQKESIFKMRDSATFVPNTIDTVKNFSCSQLVTLAEQTYMLSVATQIATNVEVKHVKTKWQV